MKKTMITLLLFALLITLCACTHDAALIETTMAEIDEVGSSASAPMDTLKATPVPTSVPTDTPDATPVPTSVPTAEPTPKPSSGAVTTSKPTSAATAKPKSTTASAATPKPTTAPVATPKPTTAPVATPVPTLAPTPAPTVEPTPEPTPEEEYTYMSSSYSSAVCRGVNRKRADNGEYSTDIPVTLSSGLCSKAKEHAMKMAKAGDIFHSGMGYAESVTGGASSNGEAAGGMAAVHAPSLLDPDVIHLGVGAVKDPDGRIYLCVMGSK